MTIVKEHNEISAATPREAAVGTMGTKQRSEIRNLIASNPTKDALVSARHVLQLERDGLDALLQSLDSEFSRAIELLWQVRGRVIVSGMGKSGHVARKIAATLASTGTPAVFVHPAEASHGDLGMVTRDDAFIFLSNSGQTSELADLISYSKRFSIPMVAIVGNRGSILHEAATVALVLPETPEACPLGLAPTTSTTMMLAMGDALAIALLEQRGFTAENFHMLHPGGRLGKSLIRVRDIMHTGTDVPLVGSGTLMSDALIEMSTKSFGCVGVLMDEHLAGIVTDGDLRRHMAHGLLQLTVDEVMTASPLTISPGALGAEALAMMNEGASRPITVLFVVEAGKPAGILHIHDCLRAGIV